MFAPYALGERLAQVRPSVTTAVNLITASQLRIEIMLITACLIPGATTPLNVTLYHDDDGVVYDNDSIFTFETRIALTQNSILFQAPAPGSGILLKPGGSLGVQTSVANDVNFMVYGITQAVAERMRSAE